MFLINIEEARLWGDKFVDWNNPKHKHSSIKYVIPEQRHDGIDTKVLNNRE